MQNYDSATQVRLNQYLSPAHNGQTMIIWATGLGPYTAGPDNQPPSAGNIVDNAEVLVAGLSIRPIYAGRAPGISGFDQINVTLPSNAPIPDGCTVTLQIRVGSDVSNIVTIAKAGTGDVCVHPMGLSRDALQKLDQGGTVTAGLLALSRETSGVSGGPGFVSLSATEKFTALFSRFNAGASPQIKDGIGVNLPFAGIGLAPGACAMYQVPPSKSPNLSLDLPDLRDRSMDAGNLTLEGQGKSKTFSTSGDGVYKGDIGQSTEIPGFGSQGELFLSDGAFNVRGSGGRIVGPFNAQVQFTNRLTVSNDDRPLFIPASQPFIVKWSGGGNSDSDLVTLTAIALPSGQGDLNAYICSLRATSRSYTIPGDIIGQFPKNSLVSFTLFSSPASIQTRFTAPLVAGGSLDPGLAGSVVSEQWQSLIQ